MILKRKKNSSILKIHSKKTDKSLWNDYKKKDCSNYKNSFEKKLKVFKIIIITNKNKRKLFNYKSNKVFYIMILKKKKKQYKRKINYIK